jgi:hypothetical protein
VVRPELLQERRGEGEDGIHERVDAPPVHVQAQDDKRGQGVYRQAVGGKIQEARV